MNSEFQGHWTLKQIDDMVTVHSKGSVNVIRVIQENDQYCIVTDQKNNMRIKIKC